MFRIVLFGFLIFETFFVSAQTISSETIETNVQYFYSINNIDSMKFYYILAEKHNITSNKLNTFVGEYYFQKKMFAEAIPYFESVNSNDSYNIQNQYYLFVCYGELGMTDHQSILASKFTQAQSSYYKVSKQKIENISIGTGVLLSNNESRNILSQLTSNKNYYSYSNRIGNLSFNYLSFRYKASHRVNFSGYFNSNAISVAQQFQYTASGNKTNDTVINHQVKQPNGFFQLSYLLTKNSKLKVSYGLTKTSGAFINPYSAYILNNQFTNINFSNLECLVGVIAEYRKPHFALASRFFVMPFSNRNFFPVLMQSDSDRTQLDIEGTIIPFQRNNFSFRGQVSLLNTQNTPTKLVYAFEVNSKLTKKLWLNTSFSMNNLKNFIDAEGAVIYNTNDIIKNRFALKLLYYWGKHLELNTQFGWLNRKGQFTFLSTESSNWTIKEITYSNKLITGGIKWNF